MKLQFRHKKIEQAPSRITNNTVAEHRKRVIAEGKRFKYPIQYSRHRLVINATLIGVGALVLLGIGIWQQLYVAQNTGTLIYHITKVIPVPVATVQGQPVYYSDYLMKLRSSIHYLEKKEQANLTSDSGKRQVAYLKQQALKDAIADAYVQKLAKQHNITVSDKEVSQAIASQRKTKNVQQSTYDAVILDYYDWTPDEYAHVMKIKLLRQKVAYAIDQPAQKLADQVSHTLTDSTDFETLVDNINKKNKNANLSYNRTGLVPYANQDGGITAEAATLSVHQIAKNIKPAAGDGYYFIRLLEKNDTKVDNEYIKVPLTVLDKRISQLSDSHDIQQFITIPTIK